MVVDTRKVFLSAPLRAAEAARVKAAQKRIEHAAETLAKRWLESETTEEREKMRRDIRLISMREKSVYVTILTTLHIADADRKSATWFSEFMHWKN